MIGIKVIDMGSGNFERTKPSKFMLCPHKHVLRFGNVIMERYMEEKSGSDDR